MKSAHFVRSNERIPGKKDGLVAFPEEAQDLILPVDHYFVDCANATKVSDYLVYIIFIEEFKTMLLDEYMVCWCSKLNFESQLPFWCILGK